MFLEGCVLTDSKVCYKGSMFIIVWYWYQNRQSLINDSVRSINYIAKEQTLRMASIIKDGIIKSIGERSFIRYKWSWNNYFYKKNYFYLTEVKILTQIK